MQGCRPVSVTFDTGLICPSAIGYYLSRPILEVDTVKRVSFPSLSTFSPSPPKDIPKKPKISENSKNSKKPKKPKKPKPSAISQAIWMELTNVNVDTHEDERGGFLLHLIG
jgi:hypothetical protein